MDVGVIPDGMGWLIYRCVRKEERGEDYGDRKKEQINKQIPHPKQRIATQG